MPKARVCIVMLNWNGWNDTLECLASLYNQSKYDFDIVLIDNNSTDNSIEMIRKWIQSPSLPEESRFIRYFKRDLPANIPFIELNDSVKNIDLKQSDIPRIILIKNKENLGFARASNQGIKVAQKYLQSQFYLLLNNDTFVHPDAVHRLLDTAQEYPDIGAFQSAIYYYDRPEKIWHVGGVILPWIQTRYYRKAVAKKIRQTKSLSGCALFIPERTIRETGYLSEIFFHGEEDLNYSIRLLKAGKQALIVNDSFVYHKISRSSDKSWDDRAQRFTNAALNRFLNAKQFISPILWDFWGMGTMLYYFFLLTLKYRLSVFSALKLLIKIFKTSKKIEYINKEITDEFIGFTV